MRNPVTPAEQAEQASQLLVERGITATTVLQKKRIVVSARTSKGWVYEKFPLSETVVDDVSAWADKQVL